MSHNSTWMVALHQAVAVRVGLNRTDLRCAAVLNGEEFAVIVDFVRRGAELMKGSRPHG